MVQPHIESTAFGGGNSTPDLSNSDLLKKGTNRKSSSRFDGVLSKDFAKEGSAREALSKFHASSLRITAHNCDAHLHPRSELSANMIEAVQSFKSVHLSEARSDMREPAHGTRRSGVESTGARSSGKIDATPSMVPGAEPIVRLVESSESKDSAMALNTSTPVSKSDVLSLRLERAFAEAQRHAMAFEHQRIQRQVEREIGDIEWGRKRFNSTSQKDLILDQLKLKKSAVDASLKDSGPPRYAQTLKKLHDVTTAIETVCKNEIHSMAALVARLEEVMAPIDNIWSGIPGKTPDLARPGTPGADGELSAEARLIEIQKHLEAKINTVDGAQLQRICVVKDNVAFKEIIKLHEAGELPKDGSLIFFTNDGLLLYQSELKVSQRSTQSRAKDAASAERHANNTPAFIDVVRLSNGLGPEGAGLWRFIGQETRIVGAAVLRPVIKDGKPVELPGARNGRGVPMVKKEVALTIGTLPAEVSLNMAYGHLLNTLRAKKSAIEKSKNCNKESFAPDTVSDNSMRMHAQSTDCAAS